MVFKKILLTHNIGLIDGLGDSRGIQSITLELPLCKKNPNCLPANTRPLHARKINSKAKHPSKSNTQLTSEV